jgi:outer membrane protein OmpA-like peptidoglycan-associated protein
MITQPPTRQFGWGGGFGARLGVRVVGPLSVEIGAASSWFRNLDRSLQGGAPGQLVDLVTGARIEYRFARPFVGGPFADAHAGLVFTGDLRRFAFDVGVGWEIAPHPLVGLGVVVRYTQVVQPDDQPAPQDARIVSFGGVVTFRLPHREPVVHRAPDEDRDGIPDAVDHCPQQPEDFDHFEDSDGCRDADNDEDGILDARDQCPFESESRNHFQDEDGCPDDAPVAVAEVRNDRIEISQSVRFATGTATIVPESFPILVEVAQLLAAHPEISRVRVEGHADERGDAEFNMRLSADRANAVVAFLRDHGALDADLEPVGYGTERPLCRVQTERCFALNRRVEFVIVEVTHPAGWSPGASSSPSPAPSAPTSSSSPAPTRDTAPRAPRH